MRSTKLICLLMVLCLVCSMFLVACGEEEVSSVPETSGTNEAKAITSGTFYDGDTLTVLVCGVNTTYTSEIVPADTSEETDEVYPTVLNDALREREIILEEQLGLTIEEIYIEDGARKNALMATAVRNMNMIASNEYHIVVPCLYDGATLASEGELYNLYALNGENDMPVLQINEEWWNQEFNKEMTIGDQLYFTIGDLGLINKSSTAALFFNYDLWYQMGLNTEQYYGADPYQLVRDYKWTLDLVTEVSMLKSKDLNNDNVIDYSDEFGWSGQLDDMWSIFYGSGERIAKAGSDGFPEITIYNERSSGLMDKLQEFVQNDECYISANDYFGVAGVKWPAELTRAAFTEGRCMFYNGNVGTVMELEDMEAHFGIVPVPIYDDTQDHYNSLVNAWTSTCFAIPSTLSGDELVKACDALNVLGWASKHAENNVANAYYEIVIKYQKVRDEESVEMVDEYIFPNRGCDIGMVYAWGGLDLLLHNMASKSVGTFASSYESLKNVANTALELTIDYFKEVAGE